MKSELAFLPFVLAPIMLVALVACTKSSTRPLPLEPPHDLAIRYDNSYGMRSEFLRIEIATGQLHYRQSTFGETADITASIDAGRFRELYAVIRENRVDSLQPVSRDIVMMDGTSELLQVSAPSARYLHTISVSGTTVLPRLQHSRYSAVVRAIESLAKGMVDGLRRPVTVCLKMDGISEIIGFHVGNDEWPKAPESPNCLAAALLDGAAYGVELVYRKETSPRGTEAAHGQFVLEPGVRRIDASLVNGRIAVELHR